MTQVLITRSKLDSLASAISAKSGAALPLTIAQMDAAVRGITLQSKSVTPTRATQTITPDSGYNALSQVIVNPIPPEYGLITWDGNVLTVS